LLHRYHNIEYVLQTDLDLGIALIDKAVDMDRDERLFQQWTAQLPIMAFTGEVESFADYKNRVTGANIDRRPIAAINRELDEVERELREGGIA
jgi:hypothetical protein